MNEALDLVLKLGPDEDENISLEQGEAPEDADSFLEEVGRSSGSKETEAFSCAQPPRRVSWRMRESKGEVQTKERRRRRKHTRYRLCSSAPKTFEK